MTQEVRYFADPQLDRAVGLIMQLAADLHVTTQRAHALEQLLVANGVLTEGALDAFQPDDAQRQRLVEVRDAAMGRLLRVLTEDGPAEHPLRDELPRVPGHARGARGSGRIRSWPTPRPHRVTPTPCGSRRPRTTPGRGSRTGRPARSAASSRATRRPPAA